MAFNRELSQFASYLALDASANYIGITTAVSANVGIGSVTPRQKLDVTGNAIISGITTSSGGFVGDLTGTASNATQAEALTGTPSVTVNTVTASHINSSGIVTSSGGFVGGLTGNVTGNADSASALQTARNIGGVSFDGSADINLPGVNAEGNQNTTGTSAGLTGTPDITVGDVTSANINATGVVTATSFTGDGSGLTGVASTDNIQTATPANFLSTVRITGITTVGVVTGGTSVSATNIYGTHNGNVIGDVTGNADTATTLETARNIGGVSFDGSGDINLPGVNQAGNQNTSGNAATATALETARTIGGVSFDGSANISLPGVNQSGNQDTSGNAATATALETARNIGGVSFDGSANINLPGVNQGGNQDTSGNAATATALQNARTVGGVSFDGTANIDLPGVNTAGNQDTSGNAATASALETSRTLAISGDATGSASFDGSANATIAATLANSGVSAGSYGGAAAVPVITVDAKGRITSATTTAVGSGLTVTGDSGSEDIDLLTEGLAITGGTNVTSAAASNGVELALNPEIALTSVSATGVVTASSFKTGAEGSAIHVNSATITGPSSITIDPAGVGDATGTVHILGDLQVEGTTTTIDSTTVNIADKNIQIATGAANDAAADGGGITVDSGDGDKTFQFEATGDNFGSSENMNLANGKVYKVNNTEILSATTLGSSVVNSSLTSVGTLGSLGVTGAITGSHVNLSGIVTAANFVATSGTMDVTGDLTGNVTGNVVGDVTGDVTGTATTATNAQGLTGTPDITVTDVTSANINSSGIVTASSFSGSGSGLSAGTTPLATLDIDGGTDIGADLEDADLIVVDDGAGGTNRKSTMSRVKEYVLGGGSGGNFEQLRVTGISTLGQTTATGLVVTGVTTATGGVVGDVTGDLTGNASTATTLETARTIGGVSFDGSANINLPGVNQTGNQDTSGNAATATALETARTIGGVSFDGTGNINLPGVNQAGNQDTSGNAATATALETARTLAISGDATGSASFDGSANATISATLANTGVSAATYGSGSQVSQITVDSKGRITNAVNVAISTSLSLVGGSGTGSVNLLVDGLTFVDGDFVNTSVAGTSVTIGLDATANNTASNLVARDGSGNFSAGTITASLSGNVTGNVVGNVTGDVVGDVTGDVTGTATTATSLQTPRTFTVTGDATTDSGQTFDGTGNVALPITLANSGVSAGSYGGAAAVPVLTVDAKGRITSATTTAVGSGLTVAGDSGSEDINLLSETLTISGGTNLTSNAASNAVTVNLDDNISLTSVVASGVVTASSGFVGDVTGNASSATILETARNIGGVSFNGSADINLPGVNQTGNQDTSGNAATATALANARTFTVSGDATTDSGQTFDGTGNVALPITLANSGVSAATYGSGSAVPVITVDAKGRITSATTAAVGSALTVTGDSGSEDINLLSEGLAITGGTNLTSAAASNGVEVSLDPDVSLTSLVASGVVTATSFKTGAEGSAIHVNTATITGPSSITLDPAAVGDATGTVHILGNLQVEGTTTTIESTTVTIADKNIQIATGAANDAAADGGGITVDSGDGDKTFQFEATGDNFGSSENLNLASGKVYKINNTEVLGATSLGSAVVTSSLTSVGTLGSLTVSGALVGSHAALSGVTTSTGGFVGDLTGDVTGNSSTATALQNARTIGGVSFDGTANINLPGVNQTGNQDTSGNAATATALETARNIGGVSFDGSANINLPGVNQAGNQDTSGNAATATALSNARTIGGVSFDGTANIDLPGVNQTGNQDTSGTAALAQGLTGTPNVTVNAVTSAHVANSGVTTSTGGFVGNVQGNINSTGLSTVTNLEVDGYVSIGDTHGQMNQVLSSVGAGVTWKDITDVLPQTRTTQTSTATAGQTTFSFDYNVNYLDVFVNGVKLSSSELTATNGTSVVISEALFEGDIVEFHSYATAGAGSGTVSSANDLTDVTLSSASNNDILVYNGSAFVNQQSLNLSGNIAAADLTLSGNLTVNGTQTVLNTATLDVEDLNLTLAKGSGSSANADGAGITIDGADATFNYSHTGTKWVANKSIEATSFIGDGSGLTGVASTDNIQTATEAEFLSGVKIAGVTTATGGIVGNLTGNVVGDVTGNSSTATALETARTIGGVSFDGTAGINLPGVNTSGNQDTSGNAATATTLETARTIGGVSFNGSANINLPGVNEAGNQNTTGTAAGLSGTPNLNVGVITATSFSGDGSGLTGVASTDNISTNTVANFLSGINVAGVTTANNQIVLESDDGTPGRMDFYCESSNAHYTRIQSAAHGSYSGNVTVTLPVVSGTVIVGGAVTNTTDITTSGNISATNFNSTSDITLKDNVSIIDNALDMINNLEGISWNWKHDGKASLGVSAQNVETVAPELVSNGSHKAVNYNGLIGILIEAVKEQGNQISELRTELAKKANSRKKRS